jgi:hypothetical protein
MHNKEETTAGLTRSTEVSTEIIRPVAKKNWGKRRGKLKTLTDTPEKGKL